MWVQVPSSAVESGTEMFPIFFCALAIRHARTNMGADAESSLSCGCTHGWPYTADAATVPSREAAQGLVGMADCFMIWISYGGCRDSPKPRSGAGTCRHGGLHSPVHVSPCITIKKTKKHVNKLHMLFFSGTDGARTHDLPHVKRTLIPAELRFHILFVLRKGQWNRRGSNP